MDGNGRLVLVFDDGYASDDDLVRPVLAAHDAPACIAIVPTRLGRDGYLAPERVRELHAAGWEVAAHGRRHRFLRSHRLAADARAGADSVAVADHVFPGEDHGVLAGDRYEVTDGERTETVVVAGASAGPDGDPVVAFETPLDGAFPAGESVLRPTQAVIEDELLGCRTALRDLGVDPRTVAFPYDVADPRAWSVAADAFDAVANAQVGSLPNPRGTPPSSLRRYYLETSHLTDADVLAYLDCVAERDALGVLAGHSDWDTVTRERLALVLSAARERGVEVTTFADWLG